MTEAPLNRENNSRRSFKKRCTVKAGGFRRLKTWDWSPVFNAAVSARQKRDWQSLKYSGRLKGRGLQTTPSS